MLTASFRKSEFNDPGNCAEQHVDQLDAPRICITGPHALTRKQVVTPDITNETKWFKSA